MTATRSTLEDGSVSHGMAPCLRDLITAGGVMEGRSDIQELENSKFCVNFLQYDQRENLMMMALTDSFGYHINSMKHMQSLN